MSVMAEAVSGRRRERLRFLAYPSAKIGLALLAVVLALAFVGPLLAPHGPSQIEGIPYRPPGSGHLLGTDFLGRDLLSRVLWGGMSVIVLSLASTLLSYVFGLSIGATAGYRGGLTDTLLMRAMDVLLAFPPLLLLLVLATGAGRSPVVLVIGVAATHVPGIARIIRTATLETSIRGYVEAAVARGEPTRAIVSREILPNIMGPILADVGVRLTGSILLIASVNFLGLGLQPPSADWALMISENRGGFALQPWAVVVPALLIAALTIAVNLVADAVARSLGTSIERERVAR